jgi:chemotaxis receptor (MCP) glutamine deamidase CheD
VSRNEVTKSREAGTGHTRADISCHSLAMCELHLALAALTHRVLPHIRLFETTERDVRYDFDTLSPNPAKDSKGIRVTIG